MDVCQSVGSLTSTPTPHPALAGSRDAALMRYQATITTDKCRVVMVTMQHSAAARRIREVTARSDGANNTWN